MIELLIFAGMLLESDLESSTPPLDLAESPFFRFQSDLTSGVNQLSQQRPLFPLANPSPIIYSINRRTNDSLKLVQ